MYKHVPNHQPVILKAMIYLLTWDETSCSEEISLHNAGFQHVVDKHGWLETSTFLDFQHF